MMMRVAAVTAHFPNPARPTDGRSAYRTLHSLSHKSTVKVFVPLAAYPSPLGILLHRDNMANEFKPPADLDASYIDYTALPLISRPVNGWMAGKTLQASVSDFAPDLILSYCLYPDAFAALQIAQSLSIPLVAVGVGSDVHGRRGLFTAMHTRTVLRHANYLVTVSEDLRQKAIEMGASSERSRSVPNGCDPAVFHLRDRSAARTALGIDAASDVVVYVGRMDVKKGLCELVNAATQVHRERPNLHVYLIGEGPDRAIIEKAIQVRGAQGFVHPMPGCSFDEVATWMAASDLVTLPSYMEGCPNVVLESLACGRPVVATNVGGIPEIMNEECGYLVPPRDSNALAKALSSALDRSWNAEAIATRNRRTWGDVANEMLEIFDLVLPRHPASR